MKRDVTEVPGEKISHVYIGEGSVKTEGAREALEYALSATKGNLFKYLFTDQFSNDLPGAINRIHIVATIVRNEDRVQ